MFRRISGIVLFTLGLLLTIGLTVIATWPDLEADFYGFTTLSPSRLGGVTCPILMGSDERPLISSRVTNKTPYKTNIAMTADFSGFLEPRSERKLVPFEPGETRTVSWEISAQDAIFHNFVLAEVYMGGAYPMPASQASCGVYVLSARGVNGTSVYWVLFAVGLLALCTGLFLLEPSALGVPSGSASMLQARRTLALAAVVGLYVSYRGWWIAGVICLVVMLLMGFGMLLITTNK
jgi:hypothetical protein